MQDVCCRQRKQCRDMGSVQLACSMCSCTVPCLDARMRRCTSVYCKHTSSMSDQTMMPRLHLQQLSLLACLLTAVASGVLVQGQTRQLASFMPGVQLPCCLLAAVNVWLAHLEYLRHTEESVQHIVPGSRFLTAMYRLQSVHKHAAHDVTVQYLAPRHLQHRQ